jgi:hypothetical protein
MLFSLHNEIQVVDIADICVMYFFGKIDKNLWISKKYFHPGGENGWGSGDAWVWALNIILPVQGIKCVGRGSIPRLAPFPRSKAGGRGQMRGA